MRHDGRSSKRVRTGFPFVGRFDISRFRAVTKACNEGTDEAGRTDHANELDATATKLGRIAGRAFAQLKKRAKDL